jgi:hypothetical protein
VGQNKPPKWAKPTCQKQLGYLLYKCCENERQWLIEDEIGPFQRLFERWINAIWDGKIELPLPQEIQTIGQLIAWLSNRESAHIPFSISQTIRELAEQDSKCPLEGTPR